MKRIDAEDIALLASIVATSVAVAVDEIVDSPTFKTPRSDPGKNGIPGLFRDLEFDGSFGLLPHHDRACCDSPPLADDLAVVPSTRRGNGFEP